MRFQGRLELDEEFTVETFGSSRKRQAGFWARQWHDEIVYQKDRWIKSDNEKRQWEARWGGTGWRGQGSQGGEGPEEGGKLGRMRGWRVTLQREVRLKDPGLQAGSSENIKLTSPSRGPRSWVAGDWGWPPERGVEEENIKHRIKTAGLFYANLNGLTEPR